MQNRSIPRFKQRLSSQDAEILAIAALTFLAAEPERLERFVALSGLTPENLRAAAATPGFLAAVLDHLCSDELLLLAFAANGEHDPAMIEEARTILSPPPTEA
ncbi:DUF3572 domain-containing protein [Beijerinckia indica]|uniref:DUF3572 domain-containing protein n=1 Tax=Beijerinckia indica subsp. indica (strain ATCC 9039 / DSM 1715 / NCIMB 8712) TaxID=395963 RepID=B2IJ93_BEII9|nr:DUF3572 domain-containing protein [Beijerinckia indica]ACB94853.1 conserved hypothetical protein [Beijerinckia indica subsp. indica ATCC 9039]